MMTLEILIVLGLIAAFGIFEALVDKPSRHPQDDRPRVVRAPQAAPVARTTLGPRPESSPRSVRPRWLNRQLP